MFEYKIENIEIKNPSDYDIVYEMDKFGQDSWDIFQIITTVIEEYRIHGELNQNIRYTLYMKRLIY